MRKGGRGIDAENLEPLCNVAEAAFRLWSLDGLSWEKIKDDFACVANSTRHHLTPWEMKLNITRRVLTDAMATNGFKVWALRLWPSASTSGSKGSEGLYWFIEHVRLSALLLDMMHASDTADDDFQRPEKLLEEELVGNTWGGGHVY